jgi:streptogramin lyase
MRGSLVLVAIPCVLALAGCGGMPVTTAMRPASNPIPGAALQGRVHGGQQPIVGASVYLYAVNTTGYGGQGITASTSNASISLLTSAGNTTKDGSGNYYVTTDSNGAWAITGDYTCPSADSQVYLYSIGGNPGSGVNSAAGLLAGLGSCGSLTSSTYAVINEVSTIATAYAIAGFATNPTHVSSSGTTLAVQGVANAFATIANLETLSTGVALTTTPSGYGTVPQTKIDTLANILAACVNSTGPSVAPCSTLFDNEVSGSLPTETAIMAIYMAQNPWKNIFTIYGVQTAGAPFQPSLSAEPNDLSVAISYAASELYDPDWLAIDGSDNVWITNYASSSSGGSSSLMVFSPTGQLLSGEGGYGSGIAGPYLVVIDKSGNAWVLNNNSGDYSINEFSSNGTAGSVLTSELDQPESFAFDKSGDFWVTNYEGGVSPAQGTITELNSSGSPIASGITGGGVFGPIGIAVGANGDIWAGNEYNGITELSSTGSPISGSSGYFGSGAGYEDNQIAIDPSGDVWAVAFDSEVVSRLSSSGSILDGYSAADNAFPTDIAIDGAGNVFVTNYYSGGGASVSEWSSSNGNVTGSLEGGGFYSPGMDEPWSLAVDGSGNVWVANLTSACDSAYCPGTVTEFVGIGAPTVTPLVANLLSPYGSQAVNKP